MNKIVFYLLIAVIYSGCSTAPAVKEKRIDDGFYLVKQSGTDTSQFGTLTSKEVIIPFNHRFIENNPQEFNKLVIDTSDYVPLILEKLPETEQETTLKKKLLISLTPEASAKVKAFTENRIMKQVAIVIDGEAVTLHKIREAITGGQIQITRCNDNACEYLFVKLKDNVKK